MSALFRVYESFECGADGYPTVWHDGVINFDGEYRVGTLYIDGNRSAERFGVKHAIREMAGHRCERCKHPYTAGSGTWDEQPPPSVALDALSLLEDGAVEVAFREEARPQLWSPCDSECCHGGLARARVNSSRPWEARTDASIDMLQFALSQGNEVQAAWRILTVHHLNGRKHDLRWWNLAALCQRCHLYIQRKVQMERVFPFEHTDWFKPHAAGWYAYAYLGEDITRGEAIERQGELLALERAA